MAELNDDEKRTEFKESYRKIHDHWQASEFYTKRQTWSQLLDRTYKIEIPDYARPYANGINVQSEVLEKDRGIHVQILTLDSPRFDTIALENNEEAKKDVEKNRIYHAAAAAKKDKGGRISKAIAQSVVQYGVAFVRADWQMPEEPREEEIARRVKEMEPAGVDDNAYEENAEPVEEVKGADNSYDPKRDELELKARNEYFHDQDGICSSLTPVSPLEMCCEPIKSDPTVYFQRTVIPLRDALKLKSIDGKMLTINDLGKLMLIGDETVHSEDATYNDALNSDKNIELIIRDRKDPETGEWYCCELVCIEGEDWAKDGEIFNEYVNPRGQSRYSLIESGDAPPLETNPHLRFRPMLYSEYVIVADLNFYETLTAILANAQLDGRLFTIDGSKLTQEGANALGIELGFSDVGAGAQSFVAKETSLGSMTLTALPGEIKAIPWPTVETLRFLIEKRMGDLAQERPSRFGARYGDAKEPPTATQQLDNRQAEAMPYSSYLQGFCEFWQNDARGDANMIIYWDKGVGDGKTSGKKALKQYPVVTTGDESFLKDPVDPATETTVTADTLKRRYHIVVKIQNQTQAEKMQNDLAADDAYLVKGAATEEQWLKARGYEDPLKQIKELQRDKTRKETEAELAPVRMQLRKRYMSLITGLDLNMPAPPMRTEMQDNKQQGSLVQAGPQMTPAPVSQPGATGSPAMGAM